MKKSFLLFLSVSFLVGNHFDTVGMPIKAFPNDKEIRELGRALLTLDRSNFENFSDDLKKKANDFTCLSDDISQKKQNADLEILSISDQKLFLENIQFLEELKKKILTNLKITERELLLTHYRSTVCVQNKNLKVHESIGTSFKVRNVSEEGSTKRRINTNLTAKKTGMQNFVLEGLASQIEESRKGSRSVIKTRDTIKGFDLNNVWNPIIQQTLHEMHHEEPNDKGSEREVKGPQKHIKIEGNFYQKITKKNKVKTSVEITRTFNEIVQGEGGRNIHRPKTEKNFLTAKEGATLQEIKEMVAKLYQLPIPVETQQFPGLKAIQGAVGNMIEDGKEALVSAGNQTAQFVGKGVKKGGKEMIASDLAFNRAIPLLKGTVGFIRSAGKIISPKKAEELGFLLNGSLCLVEFLPAGNFLIGLRVLGAANIVAEQMVEGLVWAVKETGSSAFTWWNLKDEAPNGIFKGNSESLGELLGDGSANPTDLDFIEFDQSEIVPSELCNAFLPERGGALVPLRHVDTLLDRRERTRRKSDTLISYVKNGVNCEMRRSKSTNDLDHLRNEQHVFVRSISDLNNLLEDRSAPVLDSKDLSHIG